MVAIDFLDDFDPRKSSFRFLGSVEAEHPPAQGGRPQGGPGRSGQVGGWKGPDGSYWAFDHSKWW
jgi:hypothetical protein